MAGPEAAGGKPAEVRGSPALSLVSGNTPFPCRGELSGALRTGGWGSAGCRARRQVPPCISALAQGQF